MRRNIILSAALFISGLLFLLYSSEDPSTLQQDLLKYLPGEAEVGEWKRNGLPQEYKGEDLYLYINGGAEIYHEYGFRQVIIQDYMKKNGKSISLEIFEMANSESAYGIYTFKTHAQDKELALGDKAQLADYYMNFWKGNFLVTLTGFDEDEETVEGLKEIAQAVDEKIKIRGKKPAFVSLLPKKDLVTASVKYFKGNLGLYNCYPFFTQDVFHLKKGIKGDYKTGYSVFLIDYKDRDENQKRFNAVKTSFKESQRYKNFKPVDEKIFQVEDTKGKLVFVSHFKKYFLIVVGTLSQAPAKKVLADVQENIRGMKKTIVLVQ